MIQRIGMFLVIFVVGVLVGAGGIVEGFPALLSHKPAPIVEAVPYNPLKAVPVSYTGIESDLDGGQHYVDFSLTFSVMPQALTTQGGAAQSSSSGTSGTGNALLDAKVENDLLNLARSTTYQQLSSPGGVDTFKAQVSVVLQSIFGPDTIGDVYFPSFLIQ
jgi:flagellar basal body-associated protein FliL